METQKNNKNDLLKCQIDIYLSYSSDRSLMFLQSTFQDEIAHCRNPPAPDAICRFQDCKYHDCTKYFKVQIYHSDPDFKVCEIQLLYKFFIFKCFKLFPDLILVQVVLDFLY